MRIAIFTDTFYPTLGGLENSTIALAQALGEQGYFVDIYAPRYKNKTEIYLGEGVKVYRLPSLPLPEWLFGARLVVPSFVGYRLLKKNKPDIIHTQTIFGVGLEALWASHLLKLPLVGTNHTIIGEFGAYLPFGKKIFIKLLVAYETWYYNHCVFVSAPSNVALQAMRKNGLRADGGVVSNIIDVEKFKSAKDSPLKAVQGESLAPAPVVFAGRFAIEKKGEILFKAMDLVRRSIPEATLVLAGAGPERDNWEKMVRDLDLENNVKFVGALSQDELIKLFQSARAFVIASAIESQGMSALQAMACGLPVVGVNGRAIPEFVNASNGFVVAVDDYQAMAQCLVKLLDNFELAKRLGQNGREKVEKYSKQNIIKEWEEVYKKALNKKL